jgi:hypothetical protein
LCFLTFSLQGGALGVHYVEKVYGLRVDVAGQNDLDLPDADDEPFLAVALVGQADYLARENPG